jgi:chaperonin GroES
MGQKLVWRKPGQQRNLGNCRAGCERVAQKDRGFKPRNAKPLKPKFGDERMKLAVERPRFEFFQVFWVAKMRIEPLSDKVVIKRVDAEAKTSGGIVLPDSAKEKSRQGKVLSVGGGRLNENGTRQKPLVAEGDRVLFSNYAGTEISVDGEELLILSENDILAVIN